MSVTPFRILERKRAGLALTGEEIRAVAAGAADGSWSDAHLGAFLMATAIRGLDAEETRALTVAMLESGEQWDLASALPRVGDKHSTGGVGDKVSLILAPLLAACGQPIVMLTGRGLGHTGGTADKLESIPGARLELDRARTLELLEELGIAIGVATAAVAPADRRLYAIRDVTATIDCLPLIVASIVSKKLATGAAALVFDVKTGPGAFLPEVERAAELARLLVATCRDLGRQASALLTDMSQPLGRWVGHAAEVRETLECLEGNGPADLMEVTYALGLELSRLLGGGLDRAALERGIASGAARERFLQWAAAQGAEPRWLTAPSDRLPSLAPHEVPITARRSGALAAVDTRQLGLLLAEAGGGRVVPGAAIDFGVSLFYEARLGQRLAARDPIGRLYLRRRDPELEAQFAACFTIGDEGAAPELIHQRIAP